MHPQVASLFDNVYEDLAAATLEFIGTAFFLLFGLGGIQASTAEDTASGQPPASGIEHVLYISTCMGLSLVVSAWLFFRVTGGLFNPNISFALLLVGGLKPLRFVLFCIAQLTGAIAGAAIVRGLTSAPLSVNNVLQQGTSAAQGVFIEMFITAALVLSVLMLAAEKHEATPFAPVGIGLTLFACHLFAVYYTGAAMNSARAFGPAVISGFPEPQHWVYWVGPFLGSLLGAGFYATLKHYKYWHLNPDQATSDYRKSPSDPVALLKSTAETFINVGDEETRNGCASNEEGVRATGDEKSSNATSSRTNFSPV
uniref:Aquaporin Lacbi1:392091 n=2 Tax=Laccaria bicolor (strain S238N-H82 / ATCC MYA-4686) TaxID=486041 RepID=AQP1_LACBS|nr:RecName: Full=Aquaporin Lacbi1:392091 [Laccaria bicolor S238N-H82]